MPKRPPIGPERAGERRVPIGRNALAALRTWRRQCPELPGHPVWVSAMRNPMTTGAVWQSLKALGRYAGVEDVYPHRFRHTAATEYAKAHGNTFATKALLGHAKIQTTEIYLQSLGADYSHTAGLRTPDEWLA